MKLEVGMYVRTDNGIIGKIYKKSGDMFTYKDSNRDYITYSLLHSEITKASYNIIDLIKSKDIILGRDGKIYQCWKIYKDYVFTYSKNKQGQTITLVDYQIDKVLTKEQFEQMAYKVGE